MSQEKHKNKKRLEIYSGSYMVQFNSTILIYMRVCILSVVMFLMTYYHYFYEQVPASIYISLAIFFGVTAIVGIIMNYIPPGRIFTYIELCIHSALITLIIYFTGLAGSPWLFLYLPIVMVATIMLGRTPALTIGIVCLGFYLLIIRFESSNWMDVPMLTTAHLEPVQGLRMQLLALVSAMILVTVAVDYLKARLIAQYRLLSQTKEELDNVLHEEELLLNGLDQGILIFNSNANLIKYNDQAKQLLNNGSDIINKEDIIKLIPDLDQVLQMDSNQERQLSIAQNGDQPAKTIYFRLITNEQSTNRLLVIQDQTELKQAQSQLDLQNELARLLAQKNEPTGAHFNFTEHFIGESPQMKEVFSTIAKVSSADTSVLISGESGTGKELVARAIHQSSPRASFPFVAVNCGAIPESLIESHLFGHKRGSFTGALADHRGYFQQAEGGTIFLDEIGELPLQLQTKLLRVIQEKTYHRVGDDKEKVANVRIISATNKDLEVMSKSGDFREDLYYRLNVISIKLPPLRERAVDIPQLINVILKKLVGQEVQPVLPPETLTLLLAYEYPGNIRELENIIEHALVLGGEIILPEHLPNKVKNFESNGSSTSNDTKLIEDEAIVLNGEFNLDSYLQDIEKKYLEAALDETGGVKTKAADMLGLNFRSFRYRLQKFDID